ncbi:MAG: gliding motility-associated C-terminal domain-containing protein [Bacteroidia bacterium]|nr:gliding motility-associated C-terminal domain-containing protein [Bacteroidia bacterium]
MKKVVYIFILFCFLSKAKTPSIVFKENKGQWPEKVLFGAEFLNTKFYVNKNSFNYCVYNYEDLAKVNPRNREEKSVIHGHNYEVNFIDADLTSFVTKNNLTEYYNYFLGNDRKKWASKVKASKTLEFKEVYNGISLNVYSNAVNLKYDFVISPNADPNQIRLNYNYVDGIEIRNKELVIKTSVGEIIEKEPIAYQLINGKKININCKYDLSDNNTISFIFPNGYNKNYELVIDPVVVACSYSGSSVFGYGNSCTYDSNGYIYTAGGSGIGYPTTTGAFQINAASSYDIVISAFNSNGTAKLFSTFLGSTGGEGAIDMHVSNTEITILGYSDSSDYPVTKNAFDTILNGDNDIIISKLDKTGSNLIASTFVGGSLKEIVGQFAPGGYPSIGAEMIVDSQKNVFVVANTISNDFPVTAGVLSSTLSGVSDAVVFKMDSILSTMVWSTYLGGIGKEDGLNIRPDGLGGVFLAGTTTSTNFPVTSGAYQTVKNSPNFEDMFVSHLNNIGTSLIASTYLGTVTNDIGYLMDVDPFYNVYICGHIASSSFLVPTAGTYSTVNSSNAIYKLDSSLSTLGFKTKFGPQNSRLYYTAFRVDSCSNIYVTGMAYSGYATTPDRFQGFGGGPTDMYMAVFNSNCSSLRFASYYGGNAPPPTGFSSVGEQAWGISHFDSRGTLYMAIAASENLPTTPGAYSPIYSNTTTAVRIYNDAFLKADMGTFVNANSSYGSNIIGCPPPFTANFVSTTNLGTTYWNFGDGNTSTSDTISHTYTNLGTYNVLLVVTDTATCNKTDSIKSVLSVINPTVFDLGDDIYKCSNSPAILKANVSAVSYSWSTGQTFPNISVNTPGTYTLTIFNGGCYSSDVVTVLIGEDVLGERFPNVITPNNDGVNDYVDFTKYKFGEVEFTLFDRWGKQRYATTNPTEKWLPEDLNNGTYYYVINYQSNCTGKHSTAKGFISIFK